MRLDVQFISAPSAPALFVRSVTPDSPRAAVIFLHASLVHSEYYLAYAVRLATRGFRVWLPDFRGHGRSQGIRGHVTSARDHLDDVSRIVQAASQDGLPWILAGESYGALIAYLWAKEAAGEVRRFSGTLLVSPAFQLRRRLKIWERRALTAVCRVWPQLRSPTAMELAGLSHHDHFQSLVDSDALLCRQYTAGFLMNLLTVQARARASDRVGFPVLTVLAQNDRVVDVDAARQILRVQVRDLSVVTMPNALHGIVGDYPVEVAQLTDQWLSGRIPWNGALQDDPWAVVPHPL